MRLADRHSSPPAGHVEVRQQIVDYIEAHREFFEPFIEDDEPFDKYCSSMRKNARWVRSDQGMILNVTTVLQGGNLEIQAASMNYHINVHIYQLDRPRYALTVLSVCVRKLIRCH